MKRMVDSKASAYRPYCREATDQSPGCMKAVQRIATAPKIDCFKTGDVNWQDSQAVSLAQCFCADLSLKKLNYTLRVTICCRGLHTLSETKLTFPQYPIILLQVVVLNRLFGEKWKFNGFLWRIVFVRKHLYLPFLSQSLCRRLSFP